MLEIGTDKEFGPLINEMQFKKVQHFLEVAKQENLELVRGGKRFGDKGYFIEPTIF